MQKKEILFIIFFLNKIHTLRLRKDKTRHLHILPVGFSADQVELGHFATHLTLSHGALRCHGAVLENHCAFNELVLSQPPPRRGRRGDKMDFPQRGGEASRKADISRRFHGPSQIVIRLLRFD